MLNIADRSQTVTDSKDMLAKLLASENITVVRANLQTASFDTVNRVLRLPQWKNLTTEVEEMLIGHEVGHALYTTNDYMEECKNDSTLMGYMNVIEDVRIERKIKQKYPGLRKTFNQAYRKLQEEDFFETTKRDLSTLLLIDRINLYFKAGFTCGVQFSKDEADFVKRANACDSIHDVYALAKELLTFTRSKIDQDQEELKMMIASQQTAEDLEDEQELDSDGYFDGFSDEEYDDDQASEEGDGSSDESQENPTLSEGEDSGFGNSAAASSWEDPYVAETQDQAESVTERSLRTKLANQADTDREYINVEFDGKKSFAHNPIIGYKTILNMIPQIEDCGWTEFYNSVNRDINYLVKEFEMRKQATRMKRATRSKTGDLAMNKLFAYKLTDDLFKRVTLLPDGKNHGFIILLDWSGSMHEHMADVIKQCLTVSMFLRRIQVPFRVYAFTDQFRIPDPTYAPLLGNINAIRALEDARRQAGNNFSMNRFYLLEWMSDKQSASEFTKMAKFMFSKPWRHSVSFSLGGTPLYEAMWWIVDHVGDFIRQNSVERFSFITLTDGDGHPLYPNFNTRTVVESNDPMKPKRLVQNSVTLVDPKTRKSYILDTDRYRDIDFKSVLQQIMKDRYGARTIHFHVTRNSARDVGWFFTSNCQLSSYSSERERLFYEVRDTLRRQGFFSSEMFGSDMTFILRADRLGISKDDELSIDSSKHASSIARAFSKHLGGNRSSKVMLNQFMELVA